MQQLEPRDFLNPAILLAGQVNDEMYQDFRRKLEAAPTTGRVVVELTTLGGDPEVARMMGEDIRFHSEVEPDRHFIFLGKAAIYSAGTTFMSFFHRHNRYLTRGTRLMIHERQNHCSVRLEGPLTASVTVLRAKLHEMEASIAIQNEGFANLVRDTKVSLEEIVRKAQTNWYIPDQQAVELGLVRAVI